MNTRQQEVVCRGDQIKMRKEEQQIGWGELEDCSVCGSPLLQDVDFDGNIPTQLICINCRQIDTRDKSTINASILEQQKQEEPYYTSNGIAKYSHYDNNKIIPDNDISRQRDIEAINAALRKVGSTDITTTNNGKVDTKQTTKTAKHGKILIDWNKIIGYEEIKHIIDAALNSTYKKKTHVLLCGAPGTSKTVFLLTILESMKKQNFNAHYLDATTLTSSGVIEYMFTHDMEFCLLDELDKLAKEHQATFLNTLETGLLQETKNKRIRSKSMKECTFIITANYQDKILQPLFTRMMTLLIPEYTKEQFYQIGVQLLMEQYDKTKEIAFYIVDNIYRIYTEERKEKPNLRYARDVAILTNNDKSVIDPILKGIAKYSKKYDE